MYTSKKIPMMKKNIAKWKVPIPFATSPHSKGTKNSNKNRQTSTHKPLKYSGVSLTRLYKNRWSSSVYRPTLQARARVRKASKIKKNSWVVDRMFFGCGDYVRARIPQTLTSREPTAQAHFRRIICWRHGSRLGQSARAPLHWRGVVRVIGPAYMLAFSLSLSLSPSFSTRRADI